MKKTALLLSTYPFKVPRHGGQIRLDSIARAYRDAGWQLVSIAVYESESHNPDLVQSCDVPFNFDSPYRFYQGNRSIPMITDLLSGAFACAEDGGFPQIRNKLPERLDVIHVEQPWLWPLAKKIRAMPQYSHCLLIYGSQNIEEPLKRDIFQSYKIVDAEDALQDVLKLERQATQEADISLAVTQSDLAVIRSWGAKNAMLAANGIAHWQADDRDLENWKQKLPDAPWILYVASAHPPNFTGFVSCVGDTLGCIPPDSRLVVAGSVCEHLYRELSKTRWHSLNLSRMQFLYVLSDEDLAAVKSLAHAFLLPIPHGGGSNIKTAEAIYSGKHVVGSETAFRGFEDYLDLPQINVARSPKDFQHAMRKLLGENHGGTTEAGSGSRKALLWSQTLANIPKEAEKLLNKSSIA
ncbi:hypothetical protein NK553_28340 [Pseudomonas sp. ZM23]|uniref:Glycosyltransferase n=1 Tax=Pseudomonas triclosanedens TaxID=2961893 RepID=A0ABY6ZXK2_9PSED|nr:hypothetical protein [Pseudomonas triclosanedens]MCP8467865.1 hypothetical protein [Pseudomonas triclosanedens]MCP8469966.1 hypothetical protein [Pseudomonas triclosanedens]MCP8477876.1 hypothetical protein [Pseudomonas triclosanedens]WAI49297.1 hypothetical protein OU419_26750 [Pseudomonas triclosanedens]